MAWNEAARWFTSGASFFDWVRIVWRGSSRMSDIEVVEVEAKGSGEAVRDDEIEAMLLISRRPLIGYMQS